MFFAGCDLIGFGAVSAGVVSVSYVNTYTDTTDQTTYTFSGASIGTASGDRIVIVTIGSRANLARSISSVTIAGVTATAIATANDTSGGADIAAMYAAAVPTGTTGNIVVTFSAAMLRCAIGVFAMTGASGVTPHATMTDNTISTGVFTGTIDCPANGAIVGTAFGSGNGSQAATWSGITEDFDTQPETTSNNVSAAHANFSTAQTGLTVSATITGTNPANGGLAVASWGP